MHSSTEKVSVIVPVYKVEAYLDQCVQSVLDQQYPNWELILVDDGSPDGCGAICDRWAAADPRIRVIHRENGGLSAARNSGIQAASGEWLAFLDSDDWWADSFLNEMLGAIRDSGAQIAVCGWMLEYEGETPAQRGLNPSPGLFSTREILGRITQENGAVYVTAWNRVVKRSLWHDLRFPEGKIHEDEFTAHRILDLTDQICVIQRPLYHYRQRQGSITNAGINPRRWDRPQALLERLRYYESKGYTELWEPTLRSFVHHYLTCLTESQNEAAENERLRAVQTGTKSLLKDSAIRQNLSSGEKLALGHPFLWRRLYTLRHRGGQE